MTTYADFQFRKRASDYNFDRDFSGRGPDRKKRRQRTDTRAGYCAQLVALGPGGEVRIRSTLPTTAGFLPLLLGELAKHRIADQVFISVDAELRIVMQWLRPGEERPAYSSHFGWEHLDTRRTHHFGYVRFPTSAPARCWRSLMTDHAIYRHNNPNLTGGRLVASKAPDGDGFVCRWL